MIVNFYLDEMDNPVIRQVEDNWTQFANISFHLYNEEEMTKKIKPISRNEFKRLLAMKERLIKKGKL